MNKRLKLILVITIPVILIIFVLLGFINIDKDQVGIFKNTFKNQYEIKKPGNYWRFPFFSKVEKINTNIITITSEEKINTQKIGAQNIRVSYKLLLEIEDLEQFIQLKTKEYPIDFIKKEAEGQIIKNIKDFYSYSGDYSLVKNMIEAKTGEILKKIGIQITDFSLRIDDAEEIAGSVDNGNLPSIDDLLSEDRTPKASAKTSESDFLLSIKKEIGDFDHNQTPTYYNNKATLLFNEGKYEEAEKEMKKFLLIRPDSYVPYVNLYNLYRTQEKWDQAIAMLDMALKRNHPEGPEFCRVMGTGFIQEKKNDIAVRIFETGLKYYPKDYYLNLNLGTLYSITGKVPEAIKLFIKASEAKPDSEKPLNNIAYIYARIGNLKLAMEYWDKSLKVNPNQPELRAYIEEILKKVKEAQQKRKNAD